jgi:hypothetical protein
MKPALPSKHDLNALGKAQVILLEHQLIERNEREPPMPAQQASDDRRTLGAIS